jgi:transposase-like protein
MTGKKKKSIIKKPILKKEISAGDESSTPEATSELGRSVLSLQCPYCQSEDFVKRGTRMKKGGKTQLYLCRACKRTFTPVWFKGRQHGWQIILDAMSYYNLGFSLEQVGKVMKEKFQVDIQPSTLSAWLVKYGTLCAYKRMRSFGMKMYSPYEVVETCTLAHRQLYRFRYHKAKTKLIMADDFKHFKFKPMQEFLNNVTAETPHQYFQEGERASESQLKFSKTEMIVRSKHNYACALSGLVFQGVSDNKQRHEALQKFFLANDSVTVATEVPVYLRLEDLEHMQTQLGFKLYTKNKNAEKNDDVNSLREIDSNEIPKLITGHIDFLQIRNGAIHILDYKGEGADKVRPIEQLTLYALALSRLTGLRLFHFKCAWFDEKDYFEFFPLHVVYKRNRGRKRIKTIEGVYNLNEKVNKIENLRPMVK